MKHFIPLFLLLTVFALPAVFPADYGAVLSGRFDANNIPQGIDPLEHSRQGTIVLAPWFSLPLGSADFYVSPGIKGEFTGKSAFIPELYRFEYTDRPIDPLAIRFGRFGWQDPSGFTAKGIFDGVDVLYTSGKSSIGVAALYTGFQYKETANINPSPTDTKNYNRAFNWADFANTYAAPPRVLAALYGEFPGIPDGRGHLYAGLLAQFDLSNAQERFNTQYLLLRHSLSYKSLDLNLAGAIELENTKAKGIAGAYAVSLEGGLLLPAALRSRLSLALNWASGEGPDAAAYFPIVREAQGMVFQPQFSGMMTIRAQYEARFFQSLSGNLGARYFIRTDTSSYVDPDLTDSSYFIGAELYAGLLWIPFSDLSFFLNGGAFLPKTGSAMTSDAPVRWLVNLGTTFSF